MTEKAHLDANEACCRFIIGGQTDEDQIEEALDQIVDSYQGECAGWAEAARAIWKKWPHLVESP